MGHLVQWSLNDIRECIEKMTSKEVKFDFICFIEGNRGLGKSTLGLKIFQGLKVEKPFKISRDLVYTREETLKQLATKINGCILSDEMINVAYKRDFYQEDQKELLKAFDMYRDSRNVFIGCIPKFVDLDSKIQKLCKMRITVVRRGVAIIHMQNPSIYSMDPWNIRENQKVEQKWLARGASRPRYAQLTTTRGIIRFGDLHPDQRDKYDSIKAEKRSHVFARYEALAEQKSPNAQFIENLLTEIKAGKLNREQFETLCRVSGKRSASVRSDINKIFREAGEAYTFKDLCPREKTIKKRDLLGFKQNYDPNAPWETIDNNG